MNYEENEAKIKDTKGIIVKALQEGEICKYLGMEQNVKTELMKEYEKRIQDPSLYSHTHSESCNEVIPK